MKEATSQKIDTSLPSLNSLGFPIIVTIEKDGTEVHIGQEASPLPIPHVQGKVPKEVKDKKIEEYVGRLVGSMNATDIPMGQY